MLVIVSYWVKPYEFEAPQTDSRPKSIERISTSVEDLRNFLRKCHSSEGNPAYILWGKSLHSITERATKFDIEARFGENSRYHYKDGFEYLESCLRMKTLGVCFARIVGRNGEYYYGFQVRNLH